MPDPFTLDDSDPAAYLNIGKISIYYRSKQCSGVPGDTFPDGYLSTSTLSNDGSNNETLKDCCLAYFNAGGMTPLNQTTLDNLTSKFATDYTNWRKVTFDVSFVGICAVVPTGLCDYHEWDYNQGECKTRIYSYPFNWMVQELGHFDYQNDCTTNSDDTSEPNFDAAPWIAYFGPPGFCGSATGCSGPTGTSASVLHLTRWEFAELDGRLTKRYVQTDIFCELSAISPMSTIEPSYDIIQFSKEDVFLYLYSEFKKCG